LNNNVKEAIRWLNQALYDLKAAEHSAQGTFHSIACFQSQQAAEKALKAYLISTGRRAIMGHSILALLREAADLDRSFETFFSHGRILDRYYIPTRYPDALPDGMPYENFEESDAVTALAKSREIIEHVEHSVTKQIPPNE
jgi:HEPN domain-containing protein